jgi:hypothetical protein
MRVEVLETSTTRMTLRQKAFMDSRLWIARLGCDAFLGTFGNATGRYGRRELGDTGDLS